MVLYHIKVLCGGGFDIVRINCVSTLKPFIIHARELIRPSTGGSGLGPTGEGGGVPKVSLTAAEVGALNKLQMHLESLELSGTIVNLKLSEEPRFNRHMLSFEAPALNMSYSITFSINDKEVHISEINLGSKLTLASGPYTIEDLYSNILNESTKW